MLNVSIKRKRKYARVEYDSPGGASQLTTAGITALNTAIKHHVESGAIIGENYAGIGTYWGAEHGCFVTYKENADTIADLIKEVLAAPDNVNQLTIDDILYKAGIGEPLFDFKWNSGGFSQAAWRRFVVNDYDAFIERTSKRCLLIK
jgi:hypothetical protein